MKIVISDIETEGLDDCKKLWLCGGKDLTTGEIHKFENCHEDPVAKAAAIEWYESADLIVGHNFVQFDAPMWAYVTPTTNCCCGCIHRFCCKFGENWCCSG